MKTYIFPNAIEAQDKTSSKAISFISSADVITAVKYCYKTIPKQTSSFFYTLWPLNLALSALISI